MVILSSKKAELAISENNFSSISKFKYLFLTYFLLTISGPIYLITPQFEGDGTVFEPIMSLFTWFLYIFITYLGIKKCYSTNISIDDSHFIERFTILNIPILIKFVIIVLPVSLLMTWGSKGLGFEFNYHTVGYQAFFIILTPLVTYAYYYFLNESFERLSSLIKD